MAARITGELRTWHKITLDFVSDVRFSETADTFRNHRLDVSFSNKSTGEVIRVPGYFAADGNAANSNANSGSIWRVNFNPPSEGEWTYKASFHKGKDIAASSDAQAGSAVAHIDGETGSFTVAQTNKTGEDFRAKGMILQDEGTHFLQHQGDGDYFVRGGPGVPENFLASKEIDNTPTGRHDYATHAGDFNTGDPTWDGGKGKNILGAVNYLAEHGQNSMYIMTLTAAGDGKDVWPWAATDLNKLGINTANLNPAISSVYDVSKLAQWEIIFDHMDEKSIYKNIVLQEIENDQLLDGGTAVAGSSLSAERLIYLREMIARFGHNNGIQWNLGEENTNTNRQRADMSDWLRVIDPYDHLVVVHTRQAEYKAVYDPLLQVDSFDGASFQALAQEIRGKTKEFRDKSKSSGDPWVLAWDEDSSSTNAKIVAYSNDPDSNSEKALRDGLWGMLTMGGSGASWYVRGASTDQSYDQNMDTFDGFTSIMRWTAAATSFFNDHIPFWEMRDNDALTQNTGDYVLAKPGAYYVAYLSYGEADDVRLNLSAHPEKNFDVLWYDPRKGGDLIDRGEITGGGVRQIGGAPNSTSKDWVVLVRDSSLPDTASPTPTPTPEPEPTPVPIGDTDLWLIDATTDERVSRLTNGATIDPGLFVDGRYNIEAVADPALGVGSVRFRIGDVTRVESAAPYALFGDDRGDFAGRDLPSGPQVLTAEFYSGESASGTKLGAVSVGFDFASADSATAVALSAAFSSLAMDSGDFHGSAETDEAFVFTASVGAARKGMPVVEQQFIEWLHWPDASEGIVFGAHSGDDQRLPKDPPTAHINFEDSVLEAAIPDPFIFV